MNKQEAIELLQDVAQRVFYRTGRRSVHIDKIVELVNQIDEPQKVVVPMFVAEWLKKYRYAHTLLEVLNASEKEQIVPSAVNDWILDNQYDFIKALFDGYEEEEDETE